MDGGEGEGVGVMETLKVQDPRDGVRHRKPRGSSQLRPWDELGSAAAWRPGAREDSRLPDLN